MVRVEQDDPEVERVEDPAPGHAPEVHQPKLEERPEEQEPADGEPEVRQVDRRVGAKPEVEEGVPDEWQERPDDDRTDAFAMERWHVHEVADEESDRGHEQQIGVGHREEERDAVLVLDDHQSLERDGRRGRPEQVVSRVGPDEHGHDDRMNRERAQGEGTRPAFVTGVFQGEQDPDDGEDDDPEVGHLPPEQGRGGVGARELHRVGERPRRHGEEDHRERGGPRCRPAVPGHHCEEKSDHGGDGRDEGVDGGHEEAHGCPPPTNLTILDCFSAS